MCLSREWIILNFKQCFLLKYAYMVFISKINIGPGNELISPENRPLPKARWHHLWVDAFGMIDYCSHLHGTHFTNAFSFTIHIQCDFHFIVILSLVYSLTLHNFAHAMTALMSWHVQNFVVLCSFRFGWEQNNFPSNFKLKRQIVIEMIWKQNLLDFEGLGCKGVQEKTPLFHDFMYF